MIVEASFVFPIMFYVIFFLIFFGNMYVIKSAVSRYTSTAAMRGAEYYSNPWVKPVTEELQGKDVPTMCGLIDTFLRVERYKTL